MNPLKFSLVEKGEEMEDGTPGARKPGKALGYFLKGLQESTEEK